MNFFPHILVVIQLNLQGGEPKYRNAWLKICEISRKEFHRVYERLGVHLEEKVCSRFSLDFLYPFWIRKQKVGQQSHILYVLFSVSDREKAFITHIFLGF